MVLRQRDSKLCLTPTLSVFAMKLFPCSILVLLSSAAIAQDQNSKAVAETPPTAALYGLIDYSAQYVSNTDAGTGKSLSGSSFDAIAPSHLGLRLSLPLANGYTFAGVLEKAVSTPLTQSSTTLYRVFNRAAYVSLGHQAWGRVDLGYAPNLISSLQTVPLGVTSVTLPTIVSINMPEIFTPDSITYTSPNMSGFTARLQYGAAGSDTAYGKGISTKNGPILMGLADYQTPTYGFSLFAQQRDAGDGPGLAPNFLNAYEKSSYIMAARYTAGRLKLGASLMRNNYAPAGTPLTGQPAAAINAYQMGFSYALRADLVAGASYSANSMDSSNVNIQTRYAFNKATTFYVQVNHVNNSNPASRASRGIGNFFSVNAPDLSPDITRKGLSNGSATVFGVGAMYRF